MQVPISSRHHFARLCLTAGAILVALITIASYRRAYAYPFDPLPRQPGFDQGLVLPGAAVEYGSPAAADLDKDGKLEIIVGGIDGKVHAVRSNGTVMWTFDTTGPINALVPRPGKSRIDSAPAVGDLDGDGWLEVVVSVGAPASVVGYNGGVVMLNRAGQLMPGWPQVGGDQIGPNMGGPDGYLEGFYSSPSLADLDGNGDLEIVVGGWDMRFYAWHHDGRLVEGWPRFAYDTVWSSPATADLDDDGRSEVTMGTDGRYLQVLRGDGSKQSGWPKQIDQTIFSSPAIADLNGDGRLDIVVGTGNFHAGKGLAVHAWDAAGNYLPGWPAATGGYVMSAPAVGDINADGRPEVVVGANDGKVYAFHGDGRPVAGWPVVATDNLGNLGPLNYSAPVLANFDNDPQPEVFINHYCDTIVIDGNGALLTHVGGSRTGKPNMYMVSAWCLGNTPVVQDLDADGRLEVVRAGAQLNAQAGTIGNGLLYVWKLSSSPPTTSWPMFRRDAEHHATYEPAKPVDSRVVSQVLPDVLSSNGSTRLQVTLQNTGTQAWTAASGVHLQAAADNTIAPGKRVDLGAGDSIAPGQRKTFDFQVEGGGRSGYFMNAWRLADGSGRLLGPSAWRQAKIGCEPAYYVLSRIPSGDSGGVWAGGLATRLTPPSGYWNWREVKDLVLTSDKQGYELLDYQGGVWQGGTASAPGGHGFVPDAVELLMTNQQTTSYYILDRYGRLTRSAGALAISPAPPVQGAPIVRSGVLTKDGRGVYVLLGNGVILPGGNAPGLPGSPFFGIDIAKKIQLAPQGPGAYVLDAYGRVWAFGGAPAIAPTYPLHMNEDWARDLVMTADGRGFYVLDKEGRIHTGGAAPRPSANLTPVWAGQDVAVALTLADSRAASTLTASPTEVAVVSAPAQAHTVSFAVNGCDQGSIAWSAQSSAAWAKVQTATGQTPGNLSVAIQPGNMAPGAYEAIITVKTADGSSQATTKIRLAVLSNLYKMRLPLIMR